jgi:UPF0271 protein
MRIDLNSDLGESFGPWAMGDDAALMPSLTSANVACGFHAGDPGTMRQTLALAQAHGVSVGAHPGFQDLVGFGRREMHTTPQEVEDLVLYQVAALAGMAASRGMQLAHVKAHGALYNMACRDRALAQAIARAVAAVDPSLVLFGLPGSALLEEGARAGLAVAAEAFADRAYNADGSLTSRRVQGSVLTDPDLVVTRALRMIADGEVIAIDGSVVRLRAETLCVHGDTPGAPHLVRHLRTALEAAGITVTPPRTIL